MPRGGPTSGYSYLHVVDAGRVGVRGSQSDDLVVRLPLVDKLQGSDHAAVESKKTNVKKEDAKTNSKQQQQKTPNGKKNRKTRPARPKSNSKHTHKGSNDLNT